MSRHLPPIAALVIAALLSSCAQTADGRKTQAQGAGMGAIAGAVLGVAAAAATGNTQLLARSALIGAAAGTAVGFAYGSHVAAKKAQYASTEDWLDACIAQARGQNKRAHAYNVALKQRVAALESKVHAAKVAGNRSELRRLRGQAGSLMKEAQKEATVFNNEIAAQEHAIKEAGGGQASRLNSIRATQKELQGNVQTTRGQVQRLASLQKQIDV